MTTNFIIEITEGKALTLCQSQATDVL